MNADPEQGQPTTVPDTTASEKTPPETPAPEATPAGESMSEDAAETAEAEAAESEAAEPEAAEPEAAEPETTESEAAAETPEPETAAPELAESEPEPEPEPEPEAASEPLDLEEPDLFEPDPEPVVPTPRAASTPLVAGRYRLVSEIGGGAMGVVWRARDEVLGRDVAVKELRPDHGMSGAQVRTSHQRARREGRIAARLQHPNAVVIYDVAEHDGRPYLIMEYVPSQSLGDILATGAVLTPTEVTSIGAQLASALTAAHERGIVHRDIKPGNVLMTVDGTVKLTDFGISRAAGDATVTATGEILGTPAYTAPEVAQGHPVAFPADVFSLGATLYAAVEGTPPFGEDHNAMATLLRVVRNEIRLPKRSGPLTDTIMGMLSPEPVDRPTMKQVWQGLDTQSFKPLPVADARASAPVTKAFEAPSPTLVVTDPLSAKRMAGASEAAPKAASAGAAPVPAPILEPLPTPTPTPSSISSRVTAPTPPSTPAPTATPTTPATSPTPTTSSAKPSTTSSAAVQGATPTSAMTATPTRNTAKSALTPAPAAAKSAAKTPPPPTSDHPAVSPASPPPERRPHSRMPLAIAICVVGTAVLIVAIIVAMNSGGDSSPNQPVAHGATTPKQSAPAKSTPTTSGQAAAPSGTPSGPPTSSTTSPSTSATTSSSSSPTSSASTPSTAPTDVATQLSTFVTNYYGLLPGNLNAAWPQMTAAYQTNVARGFGNYQSFWDGYQQVTISDVVATPPSTVVATIHYVGKNGVHTDERTSFGLVKDGTTWKIDTSHVVG